MEYTLREGFSPQERAAVAARILAALPAWFGIPESTAQYVEGCKALPFAAVCDGESPVGFLALRQTAPQAGEVYVMGTLPAYHRKGAGRALLAWAEQYARAAGWKLLQVKTLDAAHPSPEYARTRAFYHAMGFVDLECFPTLWDEGNPCLVLVKAL